MLRLIPIAGQPFSWLEFQVAARTSHSHRSCRGFTLAEAMMATVVLGFAAAGVLVPFVSGASVRAEGRA